jgi:hypothetical protein
MLERDSGDAELCRGVKTSEGGGAVRKSGLTQERCTSPFVVDRGDIGRFRVVVLLLLLLFFVPLFVSNSTSALVAPAVPFQSSQWSNSRPAESKVNDESIECAM